MEGGTENPRKKSLIHFCRTRWSQRGKTFERFVEAYPYLFKALSAIIGTEPCPEGFVVSYIDKIKSTALGFKKTLSDSTFIVGINIMYVYTGALNSITDKLQGKSLDIITGYKEINSHIFDFKSIRNNVDVRFKKDIWNYSEAMAEKVDITIESPRVSSRSVYRSGPGSDSAEDHFRTTLCIPFLDKMIAQLTERFSNNTSEIVTGLMCLVPSVLITLSDEEIEKKSQTLIEFYSLDIKSPRLLSAEIAILKARFTDMSATAMDEIPDTIASTLKYLKVHPFSPMYRDLLRIAATIPVTR